MNPAWLLGLAALAPTAADTVALRPGLVITRSVVVRPGTYLLTPPAGDSAVIRIRGDGIVVDFRGAVLRGTTADAEPDRARGIGVLIEGGRGVTLRAARIHGFHLGVLAAGVAELTLADNDLSYNWKPRLWSGPGHESLVDWLSYHHNDSSQWLRYGAGAYLRDVRGGEVRGNRAVQGMNGLLVVGSTGLRIWNNDFSFLSGLGIGLYRASRNTIMHNRLDWCIRGYVHGVYNRGQDSAALLLYEQSSDNVVAYNSMTHGGDGLFLWAGQSTMDSGAGGANDNLFFGNDLSFAATNGLEATFSRNRFVGNRIEGAHHGLWGGYSYESEVRDNSFARNVVGIAIEHGQDHRIVANSFDGDETAIRLWRNPSEPADWGYPRHRDTRSRDYAIERNRFQGNRVALRIESTRGVRLAGNEALGVDTILVARGDTSGVVTDAPGGASIRPSDWRAAPPPWRPRLDDPAAPAALEGAIDALVPRPGPRGRASILVDEWGPYDWRYPRLWPARAADSAYGGGPLSLVVLGPPGRWSVRATRGVAALSRTTGAVGDTVLVTPRAAIGADWRVELEYRGEEVIAPNGAVTPRGAPYRFDYARFELPIEWTVRVFAWDSAADPRADGPGFRAALDRPPVATRTDRRLDYVWYRPRLPAFPAERFAVVAEAVVDVSEGDRELLAISDDGIRVWVDGRLAIDRWTAHESAVDRTPIASGRRRLRVEYYQVAGWVELRVEVRRRQEPPPEARPGPPGR